MSDPQKVIISRSPVRIDLTGGYTDVPPFCIDYWGRSVNFAISLYTSAYGIARNDKKIRIISKDLDVQVEAECLAELTFDGKLDLVKSIIFEFGLPLGLDIVVKSDSPPSSGLGTSGSLGVAIAGLLNYYCGSKLSKEQLAELAARAERKIGIAGGKQDQYASVLGGGHFLEFHDAHVNIEPISISQEFEEALSNSLILTHPGGGRISGNLVTKIMAAYEGADKATIYHLISLNEVALDIKDALINSDFDNLVKLLKKVRLHQVGLHPRISNDEIEETYCLLSKLGGGKALGGAGVGSCLLWLFPKQSKSQAYNLLSKAKHKILPFQFDNVGLSITETSISQIGDKWVLESLSLA